MKAIVDRNNFYGSCERLFKPHLDRKPVIVLSNICQVFIFFGQVLIAIVPDMSIQGNLFLSENKNCERKLMEMIDNINFSQRDDVLKFAASGTTRD